MIVLVLLMATSAVAASGLPVLLHALVTAPMGYQDETGFHLGVSATK